MRGAARQFGVRIQREDEAHSGKQAQITDLHRKAIVVTLDEPIEVEQLAALALPSHPDAFTRIKDAMAVKKREAAKTVGGIFLVESVD